MATLSEIAEQVRQLKESFKADGQKALEGAFLEFFDKYPEAKAVVWVQFTPDFNDGDACTFSVHEFELKVDPKKLEPDAAKVAEYQDANCYGYGYGDACFSAIFRLFQNDWDDSRRQELGVNKRGPSAREQELLDSFYTLADQCHGLRELLQVIFGDGVRVTATRDGFEIDEYEHD